MTSLPQLKLLLERATPIAECDSYFITRDGDVLSTHEWRGTSLRALTLFPDDDGYLEAHVSVGGIMRKLQVHKLVANAYLPPRPSANHEIRHLDGNQQNNRDTNLEWGTRKDNADDRSRHGRTAMGARNGTAKLNEDIVRYIRSSTATSVSLSAELRIGKQTIRDVRRRISWRHLP